MDEPSPEEHTYRNIYEYSCSECHHTAEYKFEGKIYCRDHHPPRVAKMREAAAVIEAKEEVVRRAVEFVEAMPKQQLMEHAAHALAFAVVELEHAVWLKAKEVRC
ncbi:hypothetical protein LCGC14_1361980 [marine sediment metagenome]|uniref:Uncharacterized protein n=1 Tax=marine sediment metagenome TaxID=412755 RepID=A0A0F9KTV9_9ZZZZ